MSRPWHWALPHTSPQQNGAQPAASYRHSGHLVKLGFGLCGCCTSFAGLAGAAVVNTVSGVTPDGSLGGPLAPGLSANRTWSLDAPASVPPLARIWVPGAGPGVVSMVSGLSRGEGDAPKATVCAGSHPAPFDLGMRVCVYVCARVHM